MQNNQGLIDRTKEWEALQRHWQLLAETRMRDLFEQDPGRCERYTVSACGIDLDYSKNLVDQEAMTLLMDLARAADLTRWGDSLIGGEKVNTTEGRAVPTTL